MRDRLCALLTRQLQRDHGLARLVIVCGLLPLAVVGSLVLSASATMSLGELHHVPEEIRPAAVAMLEITSLTGTLLWVLVRNRSLRRDARIVVLGASAVSLIAGVTFYGWLGAVAAVLLVATVHLASRAWRESWDELPVTASWRSRLSRQRQDNPAPSTPALSIPAVPSGDTQDTSQGADQHESAGDAQETESVPLPAVVHSGAVVDPQLVRRGRELIQIHALGRTRLMDELGVNDTLARKLLDHFGPVRSVPEPTVPAVPTVPTEPTAAVGGAS